MTGGFLLHAKRGDFKEESHVSGNKCSLDKEASWVQLIKTEPEHGSPGVQPAAQVHKYCPVQDGCVQGGLGLAEAVATKKPFLQVTNNINPEKLQSEIRRLAQHTATNHVTHLLSTSGRSQWREVT